jgi:hypothetical protein
MCCMRSWMSWMRRLRWMSSCRAHRGVHMRAHWPEQRRARAVISENVIRGSGTSFRPPCSMRCTLARTLGDRTIRHLSYNSPAAGTQARAGQTIGFKISRGPVIARSTMKYHATSAALILAAIVLFLSGISLTGISGALLVIAAAVCEFQFWKRVSRHHAGAARQ